MLDKPRADDLKFGFSNFPDEKSSNNTNFMLST